MLWHEERYETPPDPPGKILKPFLTYSSPIEYIRYAQGLGYHPEVKIPLNSNDEETLYRMLSEWFFSWTGKHISEFG